MTDVYEVGRMILSRGKLKYSDKNLLQFHFDITDPTWTALGLNPDLCGKKLELTTRDMAQAPWTVKKTFADEQKVIICCMCYIKTLTFLL